VALNPHHYIGSLPSCRDNANKKTQKARVQEKSELNWRKLLITPRLLCAFNDLLQVVLLASINFIIVFT